MGYEVKIGARLDESWADWLGDVTLTSVLADDGTWVTSLIIQVSDSPTLFGILDRVRDLNLPLISVRQIE